MSESEGILTLPALRPAQRVRCYLDGRLAEPMAPEITEVRLPTARELAEQLGISERTVLTVYREYGELNLVRTRAGDGTFLTPAPPAPMPGAWRVGLSGALAPVGLNWAWSSLICAGILEEAAHSQPPAAVLPLGRYPDGETAAEALIAQRESIDGLILFPTRHAERIAAAYAEVRRPVVHLNPPRENWTSDFVSPDFFGVSQRLGDAFFRAGRRCIAVLVSARSEDHMLRGTSTRMRIEGIAAGLGLALGHTARIHVLAAGDITEAAGRLALDGLLAQGITPDAVYCAGDFLALGALESLRAHGLSVPEQVSVVGGTGSDLSETDRPELTRICQPLRATGRALAAMLCQRLRAPGTSLPGQYLEVPVIGGGTTLPEENHLLGIAPRL